jgi:hypothetical protein
VTRPPLRIFILVLLAAAVAAAEPRPQSVRDQLPEDARKAWDNATTFFAAHQYDGAAVEFLRAYETSKNPRVLFNVGVCEKNLLHYARALGRLRQALVEGAGKLSTQETKAITDAIHVLEGLTTTVEISTNEAGAEVFIDDVAIGTTPLPGAVPIDPGEGRIIRVQKDSFEPQTRTIAVDLSSKPHLNFVLERRERRTNVSVHVTGTPGATIAIDGRDVGQEEFSGDIPAGRHSFDVRAPGFVPMHQNAEVVYGEPFKLSLTLAPERHEAVVRVNALPAGATISVEGKPKGVTSWEGKLSTLQGQQLVVEKAGFHPYTAELKLADDQVRVLDITLVPVRMDWVWWASGAAAVVIGGSVLSYFVFKPPQQSPVDGTFILNPQTTSWRFR